MTPPDIFLSYNREDAAVAKIYAEALTRADINVWWDATLRSGDAYDEVTEAALRGAKAVIVLWSPRSVTSRWVRSEATIAHRNKTLLPVTIEPCERPVMFELTQTAELSHWHGEQDDKIWQAFLDDVQRMVGKPLPARLDTAGPIKTTGQAFIALLPISHRSGETAIEILAEELTEEITRELAQNCFFKVISAGTMAAWRGRTSDSKVVGKELSARYLIESKLQCTDEEVRLTVQLIDSATGSMLWSSRFVRKLAEPMLIPDDFPFAVAFTLGEQIEQLETNRAMLSPGPYSAWDHLLRAMGYFLRSSGSDNILCTIEEARLAIAAEPDLGLAHALLANGLTIQVLALGESLDTHRSREIQEHFRRAIQLDGDNPIALLWLVGSDFVIGNDETYLRLARRMAEIHPYSPYSYFALGAACFKLGRTTEAITVLNQQDRCVPSDKSRHHGLTCLGMAYWYEGMPVEAESALDRALTLRPDLLLALKWKAIVASYRQEEDTALATIRRLRETEPTIALEQHIRQIEEHPGLGARSAEAVTILRRLWDANGGGS